MKVWFNLFCQDIDAQQRFYQALLGWPEATGSRSPIYRALEQGGVQLGFNAWAAYALLNLGTRTPGDDSKTASVTTTAFATFMLDSPTDVDALAARTETLGGYMLKQPYATYYGQWQAVLCDPERHVFRLSAMSSGTRRDHVG